MFSVFKKKRLPSQLPPWEEIVEIMYGQQLTDFAGRVVEILYSGDRTRRVMLLRNKKGKFFYNFERIEAYELEDWQYYLKNNPNTLPAMWVYMDGGENAALYDTEDEAARALAAEPLFLKYFA